MRTREPRSLTAPLRTAAVMAAFMPLALARGDEWAWQNPRLAPNPGSNIHNDSWFTDSYTQPAIERLEGIEVDILSHFDFVHPTTGDQESLFIGAAPAHTYDRDGNLVTVCAGFPDLTTKEFRRAIVTISPEGELLAYYDFTLPFTDLQQAITEFGGIGYFFLDDQDRVVMGMPDGHIVTWERQDSPLSDVDRWVPVRNIPVTGPLTAANQQLAGDLYSLVPAENGYLWFTTTEGYVGTVAPEPCQAGCLQWIDINDLDADGVPDDAEIERISESHSVDHDSTFQQTDYAMYRFDMNADGTPSIGWREPYDRGVQVKPGQTSQGSGTSPSYFEIAGRGYVTIMDNAPRPKINVYRAETDLRPGEERLLASVRWLGNDLLVSDENSLIVFPGSTPDSRRIFAENNWGNTSLFSTAGPLVTRPGFGGIEVFADGTAQLLPANESIRVPSVVSKASISTDQVYTYEKRVSGWYLTAMNPADPREIIWSVKVGSGSPIYNCWYAQMSLAPDGETFYIGAAPGLIRVRPADIPAAPVECFEISDALDFLDTMRAVSAWTSGPTWGPDYLEAAFVNWLSTLSGLTDGVDDPGLSLLLAGFVAEVGEAHEILRSAGDYDVSRLSQAAQERLGEIADGHRELAQAFESYLQGRCPTFLER